MICREVFVRYLLVFRDWVYFATWSFALCCSGALHESSSDIRIGSASNSNVGSCTW